jgi:MYXO-CTERM domain-containing protein
MSRAILASFLLAALALAPSAIAKGPHATVDTGPTGLRPGQPWLTTLTLLEFGGRESATTRPLVIVRSGSERFAVRPRMIGAHVPGQGDVPTEARYRLRVVFPRAGRWSYTVLDGTRERRRFRFPAATIGRGARRDTTGFVAFPQGSPEAKQGAGGPILGDPAGASGPGDSLRPEVVMLAPREDDGDGFPLWIPAAGLALAGAGTLTAVRRRRRP